MHHILNAYEEQEEHAGHDLENGHAKVERYKPPGAVRHYAHANVAHDQSPKQEDGQTSNIAVRTAKRYARNVDKEILTGEDFGENFLHPSYGVSSSRTFAQMSRDPG